MAEAYEEQGVRLDLNDPRQRRKLYLAAATVGGVVGIYLLWLKRRAGSDYDIVPVQTGQTSIESGSDSDGGWGEYLTELQTNLDKLGQDLLGIIEQQRVDTQTSMEELGAQFADALGGVYEYVQGIWGSGDYGPWESYGYQPPMGESTSPAPSEKKDKPSMTMAELLQRFSEPFVRRFAEGFGAAAMRTLIAAAKNQPSKEESSTLPPKLATRKMSAVEKMTVERQARALRSFRQIDEWLGIPASALKRPSPAPQPPSRSPFPAPRPPTTYDRTKASYDPLSSIRAPAPSSRPTSRPTPLPASVASRVAGMLRAAVRAAPPPTPRAPRRSPFPPPRPSYEYRAVPMTPMSPEGRAVPMTPAVKRATPAEAMRRAEQLRRFRSVDVRMR